MSKRRTYPSMADAVMAAVDAGFTVEWVRPPVQENADEILCATAPMQPELFRYLGDLGDGTFVWETP